MRLTGQSGQPAGAAVSARLRGILDKASRPSVAVQAVVRAVRAHIQARYPGSAHWDPNKVRPSSDGKSVDVDIPGAGRAYHDVTIRPKRARYLKIPMRRAAFGLAGEKLFVWTSESGSKFLASSRGGRLSLAYALVKQAFQPRDPGLMPSDETLAEAVARAVAKAIEQEK